MASTILINKKSGAVTQQGEAVLREKIQHAIKDEADDIRFLDAESLIEELKKVPAGKKIIIGGGDGTIRSAAHILKNKKIPFGILPLGTMNLFANDLSLEQDFLKLAAAYRDTEEIVIDSATVNNELFLCNAMVGVPSVVAEEREKERSKENIFKWLQLVKKGVDSLSNGRPQRFSITCNGNTQEKFIKAAVIANNEYEDMGGVGVFRKKSLADGKLSIYTINPEGALETVGLLSRLALGNWHESAGLGYFECPEVRLFTKRRWVSVLLDGEIYSFRAPLFFKSDPASLRLIVPRKQKEGS